MTRALLGRFETETRRMLRTGGTLSDKGFVPTYIEATWKGLYFNVESSSDEFGRRGDVYEYPLGEDVGFKDLGRKAARFKVEGYLIGYDQVSQTRAMREAAESPEPGYLDHPMWGHHQLVSCVQLTITADYRRDKKRTKLSFEFVEASPIYGALPVGKSIEEVWKDTIEAYQQALRQAEISAAMMGRGAGAEYGLDNPTGLTDEMKDELAGLLTPRAPQEEAYLGPAGGTTGTWEEGGAFQGGGGSSGGHGWTGSWGDDGDLASQEKILDARDALERAASIPAGPDLIPPISPALAGRALAARAPSQVAPAAERATMRSLIWPIDYASSVLREFYDDALERLREFNRFVVSRQAPGPTTQALIMIVRLIILRDYTIAAIQKRYETIKDALDDLDFIVAAYDDEERIATGQCDDVLVNLIYRARASASSAMLAANIRLPGIADFQVNGVWPSVVCSWKMYGDSRRHEQVERYNPGQSCWFMGRDVVAPAR